MSAQSQMLAPNGHGARVLWEPLAAQHEMYGKVRDRFTRNFVRVHSDRPQALDLMARVTIAWHDATHGVSTAMHSPMWKDKRWQEAQRGERRIGLLDLCWLLAQPTKEARQAAYAIVVMLADALGFDLAPRGVTHGSLDQEAARLIETAAPLVARSILVMEDGILEPYEAAFVLEAVPPARSALARLGEAARKGLGLAS